MSHKTGAGAIQAKFWGETQCLFEGCYTEIHYAKSVKGGFCSEHRHHNKWNRFFVISGLLKVVMFKEKGQDETIIKSGQYTDVPPGEWHTFECLEDCQFIEVYWVDTLEAGDIERRTHGGSDVTKRKET